jgi:hypothetical protein
VKSQLHLTVTDYYQTAYNPGSATKMGLKANPTPNLMMKQFNTNVAKSILEGLITGFVETEFPKVVTCLKDGEITLTHFKAAIGDFETKKASNVKRGLTELAEGLNEMKSVISDCKGAYNDVKNMIDAIASLRSPWAFAYHIGKDLIVNGKDIFTHVMSAESNYKSQQWF